MREDFKDIDIKTDYADGLKTWNCIINKEVFHLYNKLTPSTSDVMNTKDGSYMVTELVDDGKSYLIKWKKL